MAKSKPKNTNAILQDARDKPLAYIVQIIGLLVIIANLWIATKLGPIAKDLAVVATRVEALELNDDNFVTQEEYTAYIKTFDQRLGRIEQNQDLLLRNFGINGVK